MLRGSFTPAEKIAADRCKNFYTTMLVSDTRGARSAVGDLPELLTLNADLLTVNSQVFRVARIIASM